MQVVERLLVDRSRWLQQLIQQRGRHWAVWDLNWRYWVGWVPLTLQLHALLLQQKHHYKVYLVIYLQQAILVQHYYDTDL